MGRPTVGIFGLTGCAGDQLAILNCEDELLTLVELLDIRDFLMASSEGDPDGRLDIALVEGAVLSARDERTLEAIRERSELLVALGTCALWGGVPVLDREHDRETLLRSVYGDAGDDYDTRPARALHEVVAVDFAIPGCPVERSELLAALGSLLRGDPPLGREYPVCTECKVQENACLLNDGRAFCLGPVTAAGCDARCPTLGIGCVGCRGPAPDANPAAALDMYEELGYDRATAAIRMRTFAPAGAVPSAHGARPTPSEGGPR